MTSPDSLLVIDLTGVLCCEKGHYCVEKVPESIGGLGSLFFPFKRFNSGLRQGLSNLLYSRTALIVNVVIVNPSKGTLKIKIVNNFAVIPFERYLIQIKKLLAQKNALMP